MECYRGLSGILKFASEDPKLGVIHLEQDNIDFVTTDEVFITTALQNESVNVLFDGVCYKGEYYATNIHLIEDTEATSDYRDERQNNRMSSQSACDTQRADVLQNKNAYADGTNPRVFNQSPPPSRPSVAEDSLDLNSSVNDQTVAQLPKADLEVDVDPLTVTDEQLIKFSYDWYYIPSMLNKPTYPFLCCGFVCKDHSTDKIIIFSHRLGKIIRDEHPDRNGKCYAFFMVVGPGVYKAWSFDKPPPSFKSTKYADSTHIEFKGYGLMSPGQRDEPESTWYCWNDHTGYMKCQTASARTIKKKYDTWEPTLQMIMFDASFNSGNSSWMVKTISYIDYNVCSSGDLWPKQAIFMDDLELLEDSRHSPVLEFWSKEIGDKIYVCTEHARDMGNRDTSITYGAVIAPIWSGDGLSRELRGIVAAPLDVWNDPHMERWNRISMALWISKWDAKQKR